jgi:hypothetical protein
MSNANTQFIGAINRSETTDAQQRALFLKVFSGEVISSFEKHTVVLDKHNVRTIKSGKTAQFPVLGRMPDAEYHAPGAEILGQNIAHAERNISIERLLISHVFIPDIDEAMSHFEVRSKYSRMMGQKLAQTFDRNVMRNIILAARASATVTGGDGGKELTSDDLKSGTAATKLAKWIDFLYDAAENFDNKFVTGERYCVLKPADYYTLVKEVQSNGFSAINRDYGGEGSFAEGNVLKIAGIKLIPSPMLPVGDASGDSYNAVNSELTKAICFTADAVGTVKLMDISIQSEWDIRRQGTLMVARYAMGHGILQPECACEFKTAT